jgi:hypothetical protein
VRGVAAFCAGASQPVVPRAVWIRGGGMLTRNGRILFSFGNWIAVFADRSR